MRSLRPRTGRVWHDELFIPAVSDNIVNLIEIASSPNGSYSMLSTLIAVGRQC